VRVNRYGGEAQAVRSGASSRQTPGTIAEQTVCVRVCVCVLVCACPACACLVCVHVSTKHNYSMCLITHLKHRPFACN
jgi:hypothetical protein